MKTNSSFKTIVLAIFSFILAACNQNIYPDNLPPLKTALQCLPQEGAVIAAHRGTSRDWQIAENSISGLNKLIKGDYLMAEIDVAKLQDGTLITFHDGVWDDISTAKGPISASQKNDIDKILLKTRREQFTNDRPPLFEDILLAAKGKIYLEIDFKSSVNIKQVIDIIYKHNMENNVLLISYTSKQAKALRKSAPDMLISAPNKSALKGELIWLGNDIRDKKYIPAIKKSGQFAIGRVGKAYDETDLKTAQDHADILVTDYPNQYLPVTGLNRDQRRVFANCLIQGR